MRLPNALWFFVVLAAIPLVVSAIHIFSRTKKIAERVICSTNLKVLSTAMIVYMNDYDEQYPTQDQWCDLIMKEPDSFFVENDFCCPLEPKGTFSYAINKYLYQIEPKEISPETVLLFEANLGRNGIGGKEDLVLRHEEDGPLGCNITFVDGHLEFVTEDRIDDLQWTVEE